MTITTVKDADSQEKTVEISHAVTGWTSDRGKVTVKVEQTSEQQNPVADPTGWAPTIRSVAADDRALTPSWTNQQDAGAIQSHEIEYVRADYSEPAVVATNGPETWYRVANLENGVEYEMRVRTTTASQYVSEWSEPARGTPFKPDYPPSLLKLEIVSTPPHDPWYGLDDRVRIRATFDERVEVEPSLGAPWVEFLVGETRRKALYSSGDGSSRLYFSYRVRERDLGRGRGVHPGERDGARRGRDRGTSPARRPISGAGRSPPIRRTWWTASPPNLHRNPDRLHPR